MAEPNRLESPAPVDPSGRDSRAETLLCAGLDQYFAGNYEDAIHIWTRVLFLDAHSRARAYIERARTADAERHRRADELLEAGYVLLGQGQTIAARHLLDDVVAVRGDDERASALRGRIDRVELANAPAPLRSVVRAAIGPAIEPTRPGGNRAVVVLSCVLGAVLLGAFLGPRLTSWVGRRGAVEALSAVGAGAPRPWPVLSTSEAAMVRARRAFSGGRLADALQALERVSAESPVRAEADQMRVRIQQALVGRAPGRFTEAGRR